MEGGAAPDRNDLDRPPEFKDVSLSAGKAAMLTVLPLVLMRSKLLPPWSTSQDTESPQSPLLPSALRFPVSLQAPSFLEPCDLLLSS